MENALPDGYLLTKLIRPQIRARRVARPRLLERLNEALHVPLTVVCAPAGYGKTTLLVEWLASLSLPYAWLTLDSEDSDVVRFLHYFILALQKLDARLGKSAQAVLNMPDRDMLATSLHLLLNDIAGMDAEALLVLDDYHWADAPAVHEMLVSLIENLPPNLHLMIASRTEPPLNLTRLRARAAALELRLADLSFQPRESEAFIQDVMGLHLPVDACQCLMQQTEGWPAALQLATLSLRREPISRNEDSHLLPNGNAIKISAGQHYIFEFLAEEVLRRQPPDIQRFLLHTSILDSLTGPLCDVLTEPFSTAESGAACLEILEHANLFTQALDGEHCWYRYHALFADFLRDYLKNSYPELVPQLHHQAAQWLAEYGDFNAAYHHALAGGDLMQVADLVEQCADTLERHGEIATLSRWLSPLPKDLIASRPRLSLIQAWIALVNLDVIDAQHYIEQAEAAFPKDLSSLDDLAGLKALKGEILAARAMVSSLLGNAADVQRYAEEAFAHLSTDQDFLICLLKFNLGFPLFLSGELRQGVQALEEAVQAAEKLHAPFIMLLALRLAGEGYIQMGRLSQAEYTFQRAVTFVEQEWGKESLLMGVAWLGLGEIYRQRNQFERARQYLEDGIDLCARWMPSLAVDGFLWLSNLQQASGQSAAAQATLQRARQISAGRGYTLLDEWFVQFAILHLNTVQGYLDEAMHWARDAGLDQDPLDGLAKRYAHYPVYFRQLIAYVLARFFLELGRRENTPGALEQAQQILTYVLPLSEAGEIYGVLIEGLLLQAQVEVALGNQEQAQEAIHRALDIGAPEHSIRVFLDEGEVVRNLLVERRSFNIPQLERDFLEEILAAWGEDAPPSQQLAVSGAWIEALTFRETEVLALIAAGYSNQGIAAKLVVSLNTVKRHVSSIMQKLGAKNRTDAVRLARQLSMLE